MRRKRVKVVVPEIKVYLKTKEDLKNFFEGERVPAFIEEPKTYHTHILVKKSEIVEHYYEDIEWVINDRALQVIEEKINDKTKIIIPVHYSGLPCNLDKIKKIADKYKLIVIEDGCHALGAKYKNSRIGGCKYSQMTVFSFHPVKHITTGEGGMITTNSKKIYSKLLVLRNCGVTKKNLRMKYKNSKATGSWYYEMQYLGFNLLLTDIQAASGHKPFL